MCPAMADEGDFCKLATEKKRSNGRSKLAFKALGLSDAVLKKLIKDVCIGANWLRDLYDSDKKKYVEWVRKEQDKLGFDEIMAHPRLRQCLLAERAQVFDTDGVKFLIEIANFRQEANDDIRTQLGCALIPKFYIMTKLDASVDDCAACSTVSEDTDKCSYPTSVVNVVVSEYEKQCKRYWEKCGADGRPKAQQTMPVDFFKAEQKYGFDFLQNAYYGEKRGIDGFRKTKIYQDCPGQTNAVEEEIASYPALLAAFCDDEAASYANRDKNGKKQVHLLMKSYWRTKCAADTNFDVPELGPFLSSSKKVKPRVEAQEVA